MRTIRTINGRVWIIALLTGSYHLIATAQTEFAHADRRGDYYSNATPIQGTVPQGSRLSPGSLWRVVSPGLNCRRSPGSHAAIVRQFRQGDILQVEVFRGGSDEVLLNARDDQGKPWMPVRGKDFSDRCYVRANHRYIKPIMTERK